MTGPDGEENVPHREWFVVYDEVLNEVREEMKRQGRENQFIGSKVRHSRFQCCSVYSGNIVHPFNVQIIYTTLRHITPEELEWYLEDCLALKREFPHLVAGEN